MTSGIKGIRNGYNERGYRRIFCPNHPRANKKGYVFEHTLIAEKALGHFLPDQAETHHVNGSRDNGPLVICQDGSYHILLHRREEALKACGHSSWRKCRDCGIYDNPANLQTNKGRYYCHSKRKGVCL